MTETDRDRHDPSAFATARARLAADRADTLARAAALSRDPSQWPRWREDVAVE
ncbi:MULTISPECIES: hypothetical protein [Streptomyces]|uniref:hypothetical protein n=1 Tax=Streptomyces TaxID=1883 RepID=UPI00017E837F|nr:MULTISPECIES: hypothetical protein [Streptomyces]EDX25105.1 hypothetical protein SSAG_04972 [Streptomyces sp. Mg1]RPK24571.1 hypothetical protein EES37_37050 [Streptomyces sp. ADI91-18]WBY24833.1 hypothetical protein PET44_34715 [Streptomyces goshikiensis]